MRPSLIEKPTPAPFIAKSRAEMGQRAAEDIASELRRRLESQQGVRMIFAAAPSQSEMLSAFVLMPGIDWTRVTAFHMDEYLGLAADAPQRFGLWLRRAIFDRLQTGPTGQRIATDFLPARILSSRNGREAHDQKAQDRFHS